ncbi:MAG: hypothetical protein R3280_07315 [Marinobacter sp.]|uniref:hypothetical protein n=1 Tax=Marinobacter sp. TaxID=50741 RepID=UPI00299EB87B|nr:hypothetical protein [Marinobacter sp.]MDX1634426.1 hypothetical protein [Marinobacter sp.]
MKTTSLSPFSQASGLMLILMLCPVIALAQGQEDLDVTMRMVLDDNELSERVVQELELPEPMQVAPGRPGFEGRDQATEARSQGRALGEQISEQARGNREELPAGRADGKLDLPPELPPGLDDVQEPLPDQNDLPDPDELLDQDLLTQPELND